MGWVPGSKEAESGLVVLKSNKYVLLERYYIQTHNQQRFGYSLPYGKNAANTLYVVLRFTLVQFYAIGADMSFVDAKFSK